MSKTPSKVVIEFKGSASPFHAGDVAGFEPAEAQAYVDAGVAVPYVAPKPVRAAKVPDKAEPVAADQAAPEADAGADDGAAADAAAGDQPAAE